MIKTIIFDLDGTLLNSIGDIAVAANYVLKKHNYPQYEIAKYYLMTGKGITKLVAQMIPSNVRNNDHILQLRKEFIDYYQSHIHEYTFPYKNIDKLLFHLMENNIMICVASNKYQEGVEILMKYYFPKIKFTVIIGQQKDIPTKPNPFIVNKILSITNVKQNECLYVGDTNVDILTAHNAGLLGIGVTWGFRTKKELVDTGADFIIDDPMELLKIIDNVSL